MTMREVDDQLYHLSGKGKSLFTTGELYSILLPKSEGAFRASISRYAKIGLLIRLINGLYMYSKHNLSVDQILYGAAGIIRRNSLWYVSLESVLSQAGIISQIPVNTITCMTTGRSGNFTIAGYGRIEFVHTKKAVSTIFPQLGYDKDRRCYIASESLAFNDLRATGRSMDLINWEVYRESIS